MGTHQGTWTKGDVYQPLSTGSSSGNTPLTPAERQQINDYVQQLQDFGRTHPEWYRRGDEQPSDDSLAPFSNEKNFGSDTGGQTKDW